MSFDNDQPGPGVGAGAELDNILASQNKLINISEVYIAFKIWSCLMVTCNKRFYSLCAIWHAQGKTSVKWEKSFDLLTEVPAEKLTIETEH